MSTSSSSSSQLSSLYESPELPQPSLASILGVETVGLISPETIEGGKRFWGQLVKTVSAAAGGTVPDVGGTGVDL